MAYGARRPVFFWIGVLLALYGVGLALYPHLKRGWQLFSQWRSMVKLESFTEPELTHCAFPRTDVLAIQNPASLS